MSDPELQAVESALNTLALAATDSALEKVVSRLLPALLSALSTPSEAARGKVVETLQHINVRVRAAPGLKLPFAAVLSVAAAPDAPPITANVALRGGYLGRCFRTLGRSDRATALTVLVSAADEVTAQGNKAALHSLALDALADAAGQFPAAAGAPLWRLLSELSDSAVRAFFAHTLAALRGKTGASVAEVQLQAVVRLAGEYAASGGKERAANVLPHLLVAAGTATRTSLAAAGEAALKKVPSADVLAAEDPRLVDVLFELYLDPQAEAPMRMVVLGKALLRTPLAAQCFPEVLDVTKAALLTTGVPARLQGLGMQWVSFLLAHSAEGGLRENAESFVGVMMTLVRNETEGSPSFSNRVRAFGYTGLADMVVRVPELMGDYGVTAELFFSAAQDMTLPVEVRTSAAHALVSLTRVVKFGLTDGMGKRNAVLQTLFSAVWNADDAASSARAAAVQWANECFSFADCEARLVNIIAAADVRPDVRQHAAYGLSSKRWRVKEKLGGDDGAPVESKERPRFKEVVQTYSGYSGPEMSPKSVAAYLSFALAALRHAVLEGQDGGLLHADLIEKFFKGSPGELDALASLKDTASQVLITSYHEKVAGLERASLSVILFASKVKKLRVEVSKTYSSIIDKLLALAQKKSATGDTLVARAVSNLIGIASENLEEDELLALVCKIGDGLEPNESGIPSGRYGEDKRVSKLLALGQILARSSQRKDVSWAEAKSNPLSANCLHITRRVTLAVDSSDVVRTAACIALSDIGMYGSLPIPMASRAVAINSLAGVLKLHSSDARLVEAASDAIGRICVGEARRSFKRVAIEALITVCRERKEDEIRFTAAESMVRCASGFDSPPPVLTESAESTSLPSSHSAELEDLQSILDVRTDPFVIKEVDIDDEGAKSRPSTIEEVVRAVVHLSQDERPNARAGGCVCLFTFLRLLGSATEEQHTSDGSLNFATGDDAARFKQRKRSLSDLLPEIQQAFTILLGDRNDFVQQLASCGVALVYEMCPPKEQRDLVSTLVRSLTAGKARAASTVPGDQGTLLELGGVNTKEPTSGRSATYKELCTLAQDMGQPELVYKFMDLAGHAALWNNRRGAALAGSALLDSEVAAEQLRPHVKSLLPRLYVYCHDPTDGVRGAMASVMGAVVKASGIGTVAEAITANFDVVIQYCLKCMTARQWRNREAACSALRDALVSKTWDQMKELLSEIWYITLRALDDIKESVRKAAEGTGRALSELSVHLCDPGQVGVDIATQAMAVVIPSVLPAFTHAVAEVRVLATKTLSEVIRHGGSALTPSVPDLAEALLEAATELEPQVLNYAEFHIDQKEELQNARVDMASMSSSPLIDSLERLAGFVDESIIDRLIPKLTRLSRIGIGIPTRAATARFFATILRSRAAVVEPYAARLMFAAMAASGMERNMTLRGLWCAAVGGAAKLSKTEEVGMLVERIVQYSGSEDPQERSLASAVAVGLWRKSPDTARQHASLMLPIAYMGRYETDEDAKGAGSNWKEVWSEGAPSTEAGLRLYAREITEICEKRLATSTQYRVKRSAAAALGALANASNETVDVKYLAQAAKALMAALPGHIWDGKVVALEAIGTIASAYSNLDVWRTTGGADAVVRCLIQESKRGKKDYRIAAIESTAKLLQNCHDEFDMFDEVRENLAELWNFDGDDDDNRSSNASRLVWETGTDADAVDARNKARKARKALCIAAISCQEASYPSEEKSDRQAKYIDCLLQIFESVGKGDWEIRLGVLESLKRVASRSDEGVLVSGTIGDEKSLMSRIVQLAELGVADAKYAAIRRCGFATLLSLGERVQDKSTVKDCFSTNLTEATVSARANDPDSSAQADAKNIFTFFDLQK